MSTLTAPDIGAWDETTHGFWTGGRHVTAGELTAGDVYRWHTYSGYVVATVETVPAWLTRTGEQIWPAYVRVVTPAGHEHRYGPGELLELMTPEVTR